MKPSIGRVVHYVSFGTPNGEYASTCRAAIITQVGDPDVEEVGLCAINPTGLFFHESCLHEEDAKSGGTWHWPERVLEDGTVIDGPVMTTEQFLGSLDK